MLLLLIIATCIFTEGSCLTENDWRDATLGIFGKFTNYLLREQYGKIRNLFMDDEESIFPGGLLTGNNGLNQAERTFLGTEPIEQEYIAFVELLYATPEVAVVRYGGYEDMRDGSHALAKGLALLVVGEGGVKLKLTIFNLN